MLTCDEALELISAEIDGALTAEESRQLEEHLAQCPACRALQADFTALHEALPALGEAPPAGLADAVLDRVRASKPSPRRHPWRAWASLAAVLVLVFLGGQAVRLWSPFRTTADSATGNAGGTALTSAGAMPEPADAGSAQEDAGDAASAPEPQVRSDVTESAEASGGADSAGTGGGTDSAAQVYTGSATEPPAQSGAPENGASGGGADTTGSGAAIPSVGAVPEIAVGGTSTTSALTEAGAQAALEAWLDLDGASLDEASPQIAFQGYTEDGSAYQFAVTYPGEEASAVYAVPLDGGPIYPLEADDS